MFAPSINVDLEKLKEQGDQKPAAKKARRVAARGRAAAQKATPKSASKE